MCDDIEVLRRALNRERQARKAAEQILEQKSRELYESNCALSEVASELRIEASRRETLLDTTSDAIITVWSDDTIALFNAAAETSFGYLRGEVVGQPITEFALTAASEDHQLSFNELYSSDEHRQLLGQSRDGSSFWMEVTSSRVTFGDREAVTMVIRNVSRRKQLEKQLHHAQKMESVGQLASGIAHEINTPVQFVGDNLRFLSEAFDDLLNVYRLYEDLNQQLQSKSNDTAELIQRINDEAKQRDLDFVNSEIPSAIAQSVDGIERVARIVTAMKDFSHPGQRQKQFVDINRTIESTSIVCTNEWKYCAELVTEFDAGLPMVNCLSDEINQVVLNLTVNAAHAIAAANDSNRTEPCTEKGLIKITTKGDGDFVEIRISDTGDGIPPEFHDRIFDPFFTTKGVGQGTGQGLAICYSIVVDMHGGTIHFETVQGEGTTFVIRMPFDQTTITEESTEPDHEEANSIC